MFRFLLGTKSDYKKTEKRKRGDNDVDTDVIAKCLPVANANKGEENQSPKQNHITYTKHTHWQMKEGIPSP